jgi:FKBP-type peptidyl-prolyl cis-trans isomerase
MPSQKEVRARQNRQKERIAELHAERRRQQKRRRRFGGLAGVIIIVIVVGVGLAVGTNNNTTKIVAPPTNSPTTAPTTTTTVGLRSVKGKPCVGLKDKLPKGAPAMLLTAGPAPTKLATQDLKVGTGAVVPKNSKVTVNYVGVACSTGKVFGSSYATGQPLPADLNGAVIPGWQQGVPGMRIGGVRLLTIPSALAYGSTGRPPTIAPDEPLYFLVAAVKLG